MPGPEKGSRESRARLAQPDDRHVAAWIAHVGCPRGRSFGCVRLLFG
jgi:hypothetical protein